MYGPRCLNSGDTEEGEASHRSGRNDSGSGEKYRGSRCSGYGETKISVSSGMTLNRDKSWSVSETGSKRFTALISGVQEARTFQQLFSGRTPEVSSGTR